MQFSAVEIRFIVTTYLYSTFANDLKRKYFFLKNVHSYRVCSFNGRKLSLLKGELKANFVRFPDISYPDDYLQDLVHLGATWSATRNTGMKKFESRIQ